MKRKKTGGKDIQPGEVRNPGGMPPGLVELRKFGAKQLAEKMNALMNCTRAELEQIEKDQTADILSQALAKIMIKAADLGDTMRLNFIVERVAGPVTRKVELSGGVTTTNTNDLSKYSDEDLRKMREIHQKYETPKEE